MRSYVNYLFAVDEPTDGSGRVGVVARAIEHYLVAQLVVVAFIARDHREAFGQTYHGEAASVLHKLKGRRIHGDLADKVARG